MKLMPLPQRHLKCGRFELDLSVPHIMGILNVTPDSFSDGGHHHQVNDAVKKALEMMQQGATIIDIGGESTRPGAAEVSLEEELRRVIPVVKALSQYEVILSIDTSQPEVIQQAVLNGAHIWNDVRGLTRQGALSMAAGLDIPVIIMHMRGEPTTMNHLDQYENVTHDVMNEIEQRVQDALIAGVKVDNIIIDPGFGFAKNAEQNFELLNEFWQLNKLGYPILSALSRKRFIGAATAQSDPQARAVGSVAGHLLSIQQGACMVRVHDVREMADAIAVWKMMQMQNKSLS